MKSGEMTREEMWARQNLQPSEVNYAIWERDKNMLNQMSAYHPGCTFVVDVCQCCYVYASSSFVGLLGYESRKIETIEKQGDYLESRIHPDDLSRLKALQVELGHFIYSRPPEQRNNYCHIYGFRVQNAKRQYVRVVSRQRVLEPGPDGKAWLILGSMDIAPVQQEYERVDCSVMNLQNGEVFTADSLRNPSVRLTGRETEILKLIQRGLLSKEIAGELSVSIHTVNVHRQNLLRKLGVQNSIEAINAGIKAGLLLDC